MILEPQYDTRKSFYGKAVVETTRNSMETISDLYSYGTLVASVVWNYENNTTTYIYEGQYSATTTRHQKEFFKQHGVSDKTMKQLFKEGKITLEGIL